MPISLDHLIVRVSVGSHRGPGREPGTGPTVYVFDPDHHLLEIRTGRT